LLGSYLLKDLLQSNQRIAVLVRPTEKAQARERVEEILQRWENELERRLPRPVILTGDVRQPSLGLSPKQAKWVGESCNQVLHAAAILTFHGESRQDEPWVTNVGGTKNVIDFALSAKIEHFHYVSTAYVCGKQNQTVLQSAPVLESDLDRQQEFRNDYERSKFESESLVRSTTGFETTTVYRPAVIVGDSKTGYTSTYHGLFLYLRLIAMLVPKQQRNSDGIIETPISMPFDGDEPRNLVPIDWVSKVISHLVRTPEAHGRTYHLTPDNCTTAKQIVDYCYDYFDSDGVEFAGQHAENESTNEFAQTFFDNVDIYSPYETSDPTFSKTNVEQFAGHLPCPSIDREMIFKFLDFGNQNNWGKKRRSKIKVPRWVESHLTEVALATQKTMFALNLRNPTKPMHFGLDVLGPGGGQWQLSYESGGIEITPGLPDESNPILKLSDSQINELLLSDQHQQSPTTADPSPATALPTKPNERQ
jgi:thioester reductase-like protein